MDGTMDSTMDTIMESSQALGEFDGYDTSLPLDPTAINPTGIDGAELQDPTSIITKTRRRQVKLTGEKLCSAKGLPFVVQSARKHIRISKKRSPYDNLCNFLQFYQLWAHDIFPKAKFNDFVAICNSLAKTDKELRAFRIQLLREELGLQSVGEEDIEPNMEPLQADTNEAQTATESLLSNPPQTEPSLFVTNEEANEESDDEQLYTAPRVRRSPVLERSPSSNIVNRELPNEEEEMELMRDAENFLSTQLPDDIRQLSEAHSLDTTSQFNSGAADFSSAQDNDLASTVAVDELVDEEEEDDDELEIMREMGL